MKWRAAAIREVAPAAAAKIRFSPDDIVWHLTLDQIESNTGNIVNKKVAPAREAGTSSYIFDKSNVLYSKLRPYLNKVICPSEPGFATTELVPLRPRPDVLERQFLTYYLRSMHFLTFANVAVAGVKMPRIIMPKFWKHEIPLPPISEQRRIVEILEQADALRKKRADADAKASRILPALFYKMFGDPATNPKGWPVIPIRDFVISIERRDPSLQPDDTFDYVDIAGVDGKTGTITEIKKLIGAEAPSRARQIVHENDVIISTVRPYLRATALVPDYLDNQICSTGFCVLRPRKGHGFGFLYALSRLQWFTDHLNARARGASYPAVTDGDILDLAIPCPALPKTHEVFDAQILALLSMQQSRCQMVASLDHLFTSLLHRAFSGDLTAKWREAHLKELLAEMEAQAKALESMPDDDTIRINGKRHAGHDMYEKAALAAYITQKCHSPQYPLGRVKLAKIFYLVQRKAELELTQTFAKRAAGPLDDAIFKFMSLAKKKKWVSFGKKQGDLQPVFPGAQVQEAVESAGKLLGDAQASVDALIEKIKTYGWEALERWATVLHAAEELLAAGAEPSLQNIKNALLRDPAWKEKLKRDEFSDSNIASTLKGLRSFGFLPNNNQKG